MIHCETLQANPPKSLQIIVTQRDSNVAATQIPNCPRTGNTIPDDEWKYDLWNNRNPNDCRRMIKGTAPQIQMVMQRKYDFCLGGNWEAAPYRNPGSGFAPRDLTFIGISRTEHGNVIGGGQIWSGETHSIEIEEICGFGFPDDADLVLGSQTSGRKINGKSRGSGLERPKSGKKQLSWFWWHRRNVSQPQSIV